MRTMIALLVTLFGWNGSTHWSVHAGANPKVVVETVAGLVEVRGSDDDVVSVDTTRSGSDTHVQTWNDETGVHVQAGGGDCRGSDCAYSPVHLVLFIPSGSALAVSSVTASIQVEGIRGAQRLLTVSGNIDVHAAEDAVVATSVVGHVWVDEAGEDVGPCEG
jgi:hypothetical protein